MANDSSDKNGSSKLRSCTYARESGEWIVRDGEGAMLSIVSGPADEREERAKSIVAAMNACAVPPIAPIPDETQLAIHRKAMFAVGGMPPAKGMIAAPSATLTNERVAQLTAHRACGNQEQDPQNGKLAGYCVVCQVPWPCTIAAVQGETPRTDAAVVVTDGATGWGHMVSADLSRQLERELAEAKAMLKTAPPQPSAWMNLKGQVSNFPNDDFNIPLYQIRMAGGGGPYEPR